MEEGGGGECVCGGGVVEEGRGRGGGYFTILTVPVSCLFVDLLIPHWVNSL